MPCDDKNHRLAALRQRFADSSDGVLEQIAAENGLSTQEVCDCLPEACRSAASGERFTEVMEDVSDWGPILALVHTSDVIFEIKAALPKGTIGRGFFNLMGSGPLSGHIRHDHCAAIYFMTRRFMGMESSSIVFFNQEGEPMFKIFVGRDEKRALLADQMARFSALQARICPS